MVLQEKVIIKVERGICYETADFQPSLSKSRGHFSNWGLCRKKGGKGGKNKLLYLLDELVVAQYVTALFSKFSWSLGLKIDHCHWKSETCADEEMRDVAREMMDNDNIGAVAYYCRSVDYFHYVFGSVFAVF